jgi:hypothetical protein
MNHSGLDAEPPRELAVLAVSLSFKLLALAKLTNVLLKQTLSCCSC